MIDQKIEMIAASELIEADYNPRKASEEQLNQIKESLSKFGVVQPILVNSNPNRKNIVIGGHQRLRVLKGMGVEKVPVIFLNLDEKDEKELNVRLNKNTGDWDHDSLSKFSPVDLLDWGFNETDMKSLEKFSMPQVAEEKKPVDEKGYNISYQIVFANESQQAKWFEFIKDLKEWYPDEETIAHRIIRFIEEQTEDGE